MSHAVSKNQETRKEYVNYDSSSGGLMSPDVGMGCSHLKAWPGLGDPPPSWSTHMAVGRRPQFFHHMHMFVRILQSLHDIISSPRESKPREKAGINKDATSVLIPILHTRKQRYQINVSRVLQLLSVRSKIWTRQPGSRALLIIMPSCLSRKISIYLLDENNYYLLGAIHTTCFSKFAQFWSIHTLCQALC